MSEAVRTTASPAAIWAIVVVASCVTLFMATAAMFADLRVAREQRRERMLGIAPAAGDPWAMEAGSEWPRLSQALLAAAGVPPSEATEIRSGPPTADAAGRHGIPAQRTAPAQQPAPAARRTTPGQEPVPAAQGAAEGGQPAPVQEAEPPTVPIPAQRAQAAQGTHDVAPGGHEWRADGSASETTRPDLPAQQAPGRQVAGMPAQRAGESDRVEQSFAGPASQDDAEDEQ